MDSAEEMEFGPRSITERLRPMFQMLIAAEAIRLYSCPLLVVQNSALFLVMKMSISLHADHYYTTVAVLMQEVVKLVVSLACIMAGERAVCAPLRRLWGLRRQMLVLLVPSICYIGQNNLLYVGVANLPAAVAQVLLQTKLLWAAVFSITMLGKRFSMEAWASFLVLVAGAVLVNNAKGSGGGGSSSDLAIGAAVLGMIASVAAAALSGFAGVFLEKTFNKGSTTLLEMNVWLALISMPLQGLAVLQFDRVGILRDGLFHGFHRDTWGVILIQAVGGLLTSVVIKYAGNILKGFATAMALLSTTLIAIPMFGFRPTPARDFWLGLVLVCVATMMYSTNPITMVIVRSSRRFSSTPSPPPPKDKRTFNRLKTEASPIVPAAADPEEEIEVAAEDEMRVRSYTV